VGKKVGTALNIEWRVALFHISRWASTQRDAKYTASQSVDGFAVFIFDVCTKEKKYPASSSTQMSLAGNLHELRGLFILRLDAQTWQQRNRQSCPTKMYYLDIQVYYKDPCIYVIFNSWETGYFAFTLTNGSAMWPLNRKNQHLHTFTERQSLNSESHLPDPNNSVGNED